MATPKKNNTLDDIAKWFATLPPQEQQAMLSQANYGNDYSQANTPLYSFGGTNYQPELNPAAYDLTGMGGGLLPTYDSKGRVEPFDADTLAKNINIIQDQNSMMADPVMAILSGQGSFDPTLFEPTLDYGPMLETPGANQLNYYGNQQGNDYMTEIATLISQHKSPATAASLVIQHAMQPDDESLPPAERQALAELKASMPSAAEAQGLDAIAVPGAAPATPGQEADKLFYTPAVRAFAKQLGDDLAKDPSLQGAWQDPNSGNYYAEAPKEVYSGIAEKLRTLGYSMPTDSYTDAERLPDYNQDAWLQEMLPYAQGLDQAAGVRNKAIDQQPTYDKMAQALLDRQNQQAALRNRVETGQTPMSQEPSAVGVGGPTGRAEQMLAAMQGMGGAGASTTFGGGMLQNEQGGGPKRAPNVEDLDMSFGGHHMGARQQEEPTALQGLFSRPDVGPYDGLGAGVESLFANPGPQIGMNRRAGPSSMTDAGRERAAGVGGAPPVKALGTGPGIDPLQQAWQTSGGDWDFGRASQFLSSMSDPVTLLNRLGASQTVDQGFLDKRKKERQTADDQWTAAKKQYDTVDVANNAARQAYIKAWAQAQRLVDQGRTPMQDQAAQRGYGIRNTGAYG